MKERSNGASGQDAYKNERLKQVRFLEERGIDPYPGAIPDRTAKNSEIKARFDELAGQEVSIVGRVTSIREHSEITFLDVTDDTDKMQTRFTQESLGDEQFEIFKKGFATGDFVGVSGELIKTHTGEVTVDVNKLNMLAKALLPAPKKLTNIEDRSRMRYLDIRLNKDVKERFVFRSKMVEFMRQRFLSLGCLEAETPILDTQYGGASARPFKTHLNALDAEFYMRISNELYLKQLIGAGFEGVFEFSRDFRNEGMDKTHNPEFTQVELYKAYTDYEWMMSMSENLMRDIAVKYIGTDKITYQGMEIDLATPWRRLSIYDGVREAYGIDPETISDSDLKALALSEGIEENDRGYILVELFDKKVGPTLINPTFVIDYPESTSPLTKKHRSKPGLTERFECSVAGIEVMNCYTELNDPRVQRKNFEDEEKRRMEGDDQAMPTDNNFVTAMDYGFPPMGGIGVSIDRWAMIYKNADHIREVITFPTMKAKKRKSSK